MTNDRNSAGTVRKRKLIEVALPLESINKESAREKGIRFGHPSTLHLWWARRPLCSARAVLFAQLVDDPSSNPEKFPTEEAQRRERERLHHLIDRLVIWENLNDEALLREANAEIRACADGAPPRVLDPFAGGGTIPLEAQRLGLEAHASDLNPVAVLINKVLVESPPRFAGRPPAFPGLAAERMGDWEGSRGLAADVRAYGMWMRDEAGRQLGHHYPDVVLPGGEHGTAIAWLWARAVNCSNPACGVETPLVNSFVVSSKKARYAHVVPEVTAGRVVYEVRTSGTAPSGTVSRTGARCVSCGSSISLDYVREQGRKNGLGRHLICMVAEGNRKRVYLSPDPDHERAADVSGPADFPQMPLPDRALGFRVQRYGLTEQRDLYSLRQQTLLVTLVELAKQARADVERASGDAEYATAVAACLALFIGRVANRASSQSFWHAGGEKVEQVFARPAMPMIWVYAEANPFSDSSGNVGGQLRYLVEALERVPARGDGTAVQRAAQDLPPGPWLVSTDPPYYDNVPYADLSDFFYLWHREVMRDVMPGLYGTVTTPKGEELIAEPARHENDASAAVFFEKGLKQVFNAALREHDPRYPMALYYAFRQTDHDADGSASTGWETMLQGLIDAGGWITGTWPVRTEQAGGLREVGRNALASSVVLAVRRRAEDAPSTDRRGFIAELRRTLPDALRTLQHGALAPVDLPQAAIGPGMGVFSSFARVLEDNGSTMPVRAALARINEILDEVLSDQEGDFDAATRFAVSWYRQNGYKTGRFGDADNLARARNTSVETMARAGILTSVANKVVLLAPSEMPPDYDVVDDDHVGAWEVLHHLIAILQRDGVPAAGAFLADARERPDGAVDTELVKELAFLLFSIAEKNGWTQDALAFNTVATSWPEILHSAQSGQVERGEQATLDFSEEG